MDLTNFTTQREESEKKIILDNEDVRIEDDGENHIFTIKTQKGLQKYQKDMFMGPTDFIITDNEEEANNFFRKALDEDKVEGLMFKALNSKYSSGLRTGAMAKLKETKEDLDVVILKAEYGRGKRVGYYSSFYVGVLDDNKEEFLTIGKVSSGIKELENSEEGISLKRITELLEPLKISEEKEIVSFEPKIVIQVRYQEIQKSTSYNSGYALRFPRIIMERGDKDIYEINTINDVEKFA